MAAVGYGILISALMGLSAFAAAWVVLKLKTTSNWQHIKLFDNGNAEEEEIRKRGFDAFNIEDPPNTASDMHRRFRRTHSEELQRATKP